MYILSRTFQERLDAMRMDINASSKSLADVLTYPFENTFWYYLHVAIMRCRIFSGIMVAVR
jgi:hypothetical protein